MNFYDKDEYTLEDIYSLIENEVEENIHLDYKAAGALEKCDKKRTEITKDVSALANSDGGIIVYGLSEEGHKPKDISPIDGSILTKEWLENVIMRIQPRIENVKIFPIRNGSLSNSLYVVKIPKSDLAPHMAIDSRYYKRYNFSSVPLEDYEVKDLYNRASMPKLEIIGCAFNLSETSKDYKEYSIHAKIRNYGHKVCKLYKLNFYINRPRYCDISYKPLEHKCSYTFLSEHRLKLSAPSEEALFPNEELDLGHFTLKVKKEEIPLFLDNLILDMILYYPGGYHRLAYSFTEKRYIEDEDEIVSLLERLEYDDIANG